VRPCRREDIPALGRVYYEAFEPGVACANEEEAIVDLEIPTGVPHRYRLGDDLSIIGHEDIGDPDEIVAAAEEVRRQAG